MPNTSPQHPSSPAEWPAVRALPRPSGLLHLCLGPDTFDACQLSADEWSFWGRSLVQEYNRLTGVPLPLVTLTRTASLPLMGYSLRYNGDSLLDGVLPAGHVYAVPKRTIRGLPPGEMTTHCGAEPFAIWVPAAYGGSAEWMGYAVMQYPAVLLGRSLRALQYIGAQFITDPVSNAIAGGLRFAAPELSRRLRALDWSGRAFTDLLRALYRLNGTLDGLRQTLEPIRLESAQYFPTTSPEALATWLRRRAAEERPAS